MTGLVDAVRDRVPEQCLVEECDKNGCSVSLRGAPKPHLIIDLDGPSSPLGRHRTRCDYLFIADECSDRSWVVPMEFKNSQMKVGKVVRQLQAGARAAQELASSRNGIRFRPVAVVRGIHRRQRNELRSESNEVPFRGCSERIRVLVCDDLLIDALRE